MSTGEKLTNWPAWKFNPYFFVWVAIAIGAVLGVAHRAFKAPLGPIVALFGAVLACCGVVTIGRPVIRVGGYLEWYRQSLIVDGGHSPPTPEEIEQSRQGQLDAIALQIVGPTLVILGTMLGGASGFLS